MWFSSHTNNLVYNKVENYELELKFGQGQTLQAAALHDDGSVGYRQSGHLAVPLRDHQATHLRHSHCLYLYHPKESRLHTQSFQVGAFLK